ncbi:ABC transporter substrate-binding protein, partial [Mesorhizobium sp. M7A.F.Ca.MR.362.00.0.0]
MTSAVPGTLAAFLCFFSLTVNVSDATGQETVAKPEKKTTEIKIGYLRAYAPQLTLSMLDLPPRDEGVAGAEVAIGDNNTTGKFTNQKFSLDVTEIKPDGDAVQAFEGMIAKGDRYVVADLSAKQLLSIADIARDKGVLIFNVGATDDSLREEDCRVNVFHVAPTRSMLA